MTDGLDTHDLDHLETLDADAPESPAGGLEPGARVGDKYAIVRLLGHGGMGAVYLARDERLARDVAIKVGLAAGSGALARAEREAQALARLSHPNVVVIYEVGEHGGRLFVAMEYVKGGTARAWLAAKPRTWREIVALYCDAGAGLAAAHAAGIVHRDFKPDNVLVGDDGRPRVADFGLARAPGTSDSVDAESPVSGVAPLSDRLTRTGAAIGTPAYMAPEQLDLADIDERVDQFAFCIALWEALHGARPFAGKTREELREGMRVAPRAINAKVPRYVSDALRRGLARDPAARWPTMAALIARLRRDRPRLGLAAIGGLAIFAVTAAIVPMVALRSGDPCSGGAEELARVWSPQREVALHVAFAGAGGQAAWNAIDGQLRDYAGRWIDASRAACRATHDGGQSEAMLDKRMSCLFEARTRLAAVGDALSSGERHAVIAATGELGLLPQLEACANVESLAHEAAPPTDPVSRARVAAIEDTLARIRTKQLRREPVEPAALAPIVDAASATGWAPLEASARAVQAGAQLDNGDLAHGRAELEGATAAFLAAGDDAGAANAMVDLAESFATSGSVADEQRWTRLAEGLVHRLHDPPQLGTQIAELDAMALEAGPRRRDAAPLRQRQADLAGVAYHDPVNEAVSHLNRSVGFRDVEDFAGARRELLQGIAIAERVLGRDHPDLVPFQIGLGTADMMIGRFDDAERDQQRALAIIERWFGPDNRRFVLTLEDLGATRQRRGDVRGSLEVTQRALAIEQRIDPSGQSAAELEANVAIDLATMGDLAGAAPHAAHAVAQLERVVGPDSGILVESYVLVGFIERGLGHLEASRTALARAVAIADKADADRVNPRDELSYTLVLMHRTAEAVAELDAIAKVADKDEPRIAAEYHFALAKALVETGARDRAITEATHSRDAFTALGADFKPQADEAAAWLNHHR